MAHARTTSCRPSGTSGSFDQPAAEATSTERLRTRNPGMPRSPSPRLARQSSRTSAIVAESLSVRVASLAVERKFAATQISAPYDPEKGHGRATRRPQHWTLPKAPNGWIGWHAVIERRSRSRRGWRRPCRQRGHPHFWRASGCRPSKPSGNAQPELPQAADPGIDAPHAPLCQKPPASAEIDSKSQGRGERQFDRIVATPDQPSPTCAGAEIGPERTPHRLELKLGLRNQVADPIVTLGCVVEVLETGFEHEEANGARVESGP